MIAANSGEENVLAIKAFRMLSVLCAAHCHGGLRGVFSSAVSPAHAAKIYFGTQDYLRPIQDVAIKGPNGEELYLGNKYSFHSFVMPYSLSDDGYILGVKGRNAIFLLDKTKIERFQASGPLPTPLPAYELSALDYVMGHLL